MGVGQKFSPASVWFSVQCYQIDFLWYSSVTAPPPYVLRQVQDTVKVD